ncbi:MAG: 3-methyl-2-oxobutanoate hydroxymethyltransferase [Firmicutes bacterium]|nr:3-methyl-2-oxobutanoate hydroxymethyltransferase [Bacillota bacterium]
MQTVREFQQSKGKFLTAWITAYDVTQAQIAEAAEMDGILVGDSLGMTMLGYANTLPVTVDDMVSHAQSVRRGAPHTLMIVDLPYLSYSDPSTAIKSSARLMKDAWADGVKLEGGAERADTIRRLVTEGIPVIGHLGLTPQNIHGMGGYKVQAKTVQAIQKIVYDAQIVAQAGAGGLVLEGIPNPVAAYITKTIAIPTIGIGAGPHCDSQILVFHDAMGLSDRQPKFAKAFKSLRHDMVEGLQTYRKEACAQSFPDDAHSYHLSENTWNLFLNSQSPSDKEGE